MAYSELIKSGNSYNTPVKKFYCSSVDGVSSLPTNVPFGSECIVKNGETLDVYLLRKTSDSEGIWVKREST